ncbi:MAG: tetratricopeptide repeat protein, partial [Flavobacteriaceae bacterium]
MKPFQLYKDLLPTIYWIGIILLLSPTILPAQKQQKVLDSLLTALKSMPSDTSRVQTYGQISRLYAVNLDNAELATRYVDSVQLLSNQLQFETGKSYGFFLQGLIDYKSGNYDKSLESYKKAHLGYLKTADSTYAISALQGMAQAYRQQGAYEKSLELLLRAAKFYEGRDPSYPLAVSYTGIANLFRVLEKFDSSISYHRKSLDILKNLGYTNLYAMGLQNMANVYVEK